MLTSVFSLFVGKMNANRAKLKNERRISEACRIHLLADFRFAKINSLCLSLIVFFHFNVSQDGIDQAVRQLQARDFSQVIAEFSIFAICSGDRNGVAGADDVAEEFGNVDFFWRRGGEGRCVVS